MHPKDKERHTKTLLLQAAEDLLDADRDSTDYGLTRGRFRRLLDECGEAHRQAHATAYAKLAQELKLPGEAESYAQRLLARGTA